jgi:hypothetical protein
MQDSFDIQGMIKQYPELLYAFLAVISYILSVFFAVIEYGSIIEFNGLEIHAISTPLWLLFGVASLYFLYTAFFDMWIYAIHLIFAYYLTGAGFLGLYVFYDNVTIRVFAIILIIAGLGFIGYFIYRIGNVRSYRILNSPDPDSARDRFSLELWYFFPFVFFVISAISFWDLGRSYDDGGTPYLHVFMEIALILTIVYIMWKPENVLFYGTKESWPDVPISEISEVGGGEPESAGSGSSPRQSEQQTSPQKPLQAVESRIRRKPASVMCPGFDTPAVQSSRICPGCGSANDFNWCSESEEFLISCPSCSQQTYHGRKVCVHCRSRLVEDITCSHCGKEYPARRFKESA